MSYKERPGLLLLNGVVYTSWSSHCDIGVYHGWIIGYNAQTLQQVAVYNDTPNGQEGSVWASGAAPAADAAGNVKYPNVNPLIEMTDMRDAQRSYEANLNIISATRRMVQRTLDILKS